MKSNIKIFPIIILALMLIYSNLLSFDYFSKYNLLDIPIEIKSDSNNFIPSYDNIRPKIGIAFSGGGSRGFAQVGALTALSKAGIHIDYVVGTSIGSVVAGLLAVGYTPFQLDSIIKNTNWQEIITFRDEQSRGDLFLDQKIIQDRSLITLRFQDFEFVVPEAISLGTKFTSFLQKLIWDGLYHENGNFNSLKIPFRAVATDLRSGNTVTLKSGNLVTAIRASASFPLRYTPVRIDSMVLVDGGLMSNIPTKTLEQFNPDISIAINTISPLLEPELLNKPWNIADQVVSLLMKRFSDSAAKDADFNISPELGKHGYTEFKNLDSLLLKSEIETEKYISQIQNKFNEILDSKIKYKLNLLSHEIESIVFIGFDDDDLNKLNSVKKNSSNYLDLTIKQLREILILDKYHYLKINKSADNYFIQINAVKFPKINSIKLFTETNYYPNYSTLQEEINKIYSSKLFNNNNLENIVESILRVLRDKGLSFAEIVNIEFDKTNAELKLFLSEGLIKNIIIDESSENDYLIKRELKFSKGDYLNSKLILETWENLLSIDFISEAEISLIKDSIESGTTIKIMTKNIGDQSVRIGARVDNERFTRLGIDLIQDNAFNLGTRLSLRFVGGIRDKQLVFKSENTRIFNTMLTNASSIYYDYTDKHLYSKKPETNRNRFEYTTTNDYSEERFGAKILFGAQMEKKGTISSQFRFEKLRFWENGNEPGDFKNLLSLTISSIFDDEDRSDFPTKGSLLDMSLETTLFKNANSVVFSKVKLFYRSNYNFNVFYLKPSIYFGFADGTTPFPEFFSLGGQDSFFGMREDELRGRQISVGSVEMRFKSPYSLIFDTYLLLRYDLGSSWENFETIKFSGLRHGIGTTLAFDTPLGPANFSLGRSFYFLKNPNAVAWGQVMGYFSIGMNL